MINYCDTLKEKICFRISISSHLDDVFSLCLLRFPLLALSQQRLKMKHFVQIVCVFVLRYFDDLIIVWTGPKWVQSLQTLRFLQLSRSWTREPPDPTPSLFFCASVWRFRTFECRVEWHHQTVSWTSDWQKIWTLTTTSITKFRNFVATTMNICSIKPITLRSETKTAFMQYLGLARH